MVNFSWEIYEYACKTLFLLPCGLLERILNCKVRALSFILGFATHSSVTLGKVLSHSAGNCYCVDKDMSDDG